jgi:hypothetical protein
MLLNTKEKMSLGMGLDLSDIKKAEEKIKLPTKDLK